MTDRNSRSSRDDDRGSRHRESSRDEPVSRRSGRDEPERSSRRGGRDEPDSDRGHRTERHGRDEGRSTRRFEYQDRDAADVKKRASQQGANEFDKILKDSVKMFKPNDGENRIRILPPTWEGAKHFGLDVFVHYGVGPDRGTYLCLNKMKGEDDPIEEERLIARKDGDEKYAKELEAKRRVLVYLIDRDHEKDGVQAWAMPWTVDRDIVKVSVDRSSGEVLPIDHPEDGYDVEFEKKGAKDRTEYIGIAIARRSTPLGKDDWLDFAMDNPLPEQLNYYDYDHINKAFNGGGAHKEKDRGDGHDDRDSDRGRGRERDEPKRGREKEPPNWDDIHDMTAREMEDLIDEQKLDIDPVDSKDREDLADWICEEMKIKKESKPTRREPLKEDRAEESTSDRLRRMRESRRD
jgi:hypothetical protein